MHVSIRMIGIATTVFWLFLIAFVVLAAYSVKDLSFDFGEPAADLDVNGDLLISLPITIVNRGYTNLEAFRVLTQLMGSDGAVIARGSTSVPVVRRDTSVVTAHSVSVDFDSLLNRDENYLFSDTVLTLNATVGMTLAQLVPVEARGNFTMPWGAPLYNFAVGVPAFAPEEAVSMVVSVPISFENHAFFDLDGDVRLLMFNSSGGPIAEGETVLDVSQGAAYDGNVELVFTASDLTSSGRFEVYVHTALFDYGPLVVPYG
jgi:hypothetical protein